MTSVRQNLHALEAYQRFPAELSAWLQSIDRYMVELAQFIDGTMGQMTHRLDINSKLFEQHVDAIILAIAAFETWQAVIDLTVNWKQHCASCSNDNYDYFSCSLSFLCPKLPILPIPPFKIPNINIDLSHLDLGVDFVLPRINIQPIPMPLPSLPDLPYPPTVEIDLLNIDLYIPSIPVIPSPPDLPPLPSFIPRIKMSLPTLPPAPKIPVLSSKFDKILNISKTIGNLFCIMKSDI